MNKKVFALAACFSIATLFSCQGQKGKSAANLKNNADSVAYAIGISIGSNMKKDGLDSLNLDVLKIAIQSAIKGDSLMLTQMEAQSVIQAYLGDKAKAKGDANVAKGKAFLAENKKKYRQVFDRYETSYIYAELSFYNKMFDRDSWDVEMELKCYEV